MPFARAARGLVSWFNNSGAVLVFKFLTPERVAAFGHGLVALAALEALPWLQVRLLIRAFEALSFAGGAAHVGILLGPRAVSGLGRGNVGAQQQPQAKE